LIRLLERGKYISVQNVEHSFDANDSARVIRLGHRQLDLLGFHAAKLSPISQTGRAVIETTRRGFQETCINR
jgi:hypothetical protein